MPTDLWLISKKDHPLAVRGKVRKPVVVLVRRDLLLAGPVGTHAPDLHGAGAPGIEIDVPSVGRIFGGIVGRACRSQACLLTTSYRDAEDIQVSVAIAGE